MNSDIAIETSDVTYTAPNSSIKLCIGLNFSFKQGTNVLVTGASGCGKSSLLRVINVLDEATSQVGFPMERVLYEKCASLNITLLSVGHRDSIRKFHDIELNIEIGGSWSLKPISRTEPGACFVPP
ncbi:ABCD4-like protein [Mya arenaria]|uniref:ABCD4-like protein n=1 Tax=Mya arenaria TaxID=6604 RepID=A0ABY7FCQ3_MYAAR|nr:ABCD4-like protein [Mya arenaria]